MKKNQLKLYFFEILLIIFLFFALFASSIITRIITAFLMLAYTLIVINVFKRKQIKSTYSRQVKILMLIYAVIYVVIFYILGLIFGFEKAKIMFSWWSIANYIIPITIIIVTSEIIRERFISQGIKLDFRGRKVNLSLFLTYIAMVLVDMVIYTGVYNLNNLDDFLIAVGFVLFSSLSCNLFYNYVTIRFGSKSVMIYRLITILFVYFIPIVTSLVFFFRTFLRMTYPYIMYLFMEWTFAKVSFAISYKDKKRFFWEISLSFLFMTLVVMIISCQFTYGIIVVGSRSMTGSIEIGDCVVFKNFKHDDTIENNEVIIFDSQGVKTVHRIVDIQEINGEKRIYTKGDANPEVDEGYIHEDNIDGIVKFRIKYLGYPSLYLRELFNK